MMTPEKDLRADAALTDPAFAALFNEIRALGDRPAPPMSDALCSLIASTAPVVVPMHSRWRRALVGGGITVAVVATGLGAAAAEVLPGPAETAISNAVEVLTPFTLDVSDETHPTQAKPQRPAPMRHHIITAGGSNRTGEKDCRGCSNGNHFGVLKERGQHPETGANTDQGGRSVAPGQVKSDSGPAVPGQANHNDGRKTASDPAANGSATDKRSSGSDDRSKDRDRKSRSDKRDTSSHDKKSKK